MPTIAELLAQYRDRTGASYEDMSRSVNGAITAAWFHKLTTTTPDSFPRKPATVQQLAELLQMPITTILESFALSLGLPVAPPKSLLAITLPPGTDSLESGDVDAIRAVIRQLVAARKAASPIPPSPDQPEPDMSKVQGIRLDETSPTLRVVEQSRGSDDS